ncbi:MAG: ABC transporter ATPase [Flavobacteriaceae bacterium]|nr:ABC transporter ATPase [Flavobacteriaceae bacterium]MCY4216401.1 ABC transporter ATPase [Flavobacteriaceae bacterium]MCY4253712.1 ABC transporter ATPase [Flavobacteriaceae bacterium]
MLVSFDSLSEDSRIWIFQSNQFLSSKQMDTITFELNRFLKQWVSHQVSLSAGFTIINNLFVIIGLDHNQTTSGCSIDAMMHAIQAIEKRMDLQLLNRTNVAFQINGKIQMIGLNEFQDLINRKSINRSTVVFNNMVSTIKELKTNWKVPLENSWHKRYLMS